MQKMLRQTANKIMVRDFHEQYFFKTKIVFPPGGSYARRLLENDTFFLFSDNHFLPAPAGLFHQRRRHSGSDPHGGGGRGRERHHLADFHFLTIRIRRFRGLLRGDLLPGGREQRRGRAKILRNAGRAFRGTYRGAHRTGTGAAEAHARVDKRHAGQPGGLQSGVHLLRHNLRRNRRAAFLQLYMLVFAEYGRLRNAAFISAFFHGAQRGT